MRFKIIILSSIFVCNSWAQKNKMSRLEYIDKYKELSMDEMRRTGIPASITLAQGILESGNGNSTLATKANNHFGIKCHDWKGPSVKHDDDAKNECFRKYRSPEQSYHDHSEFLTSRGRYSFLFELKQDDYKSWAKGLKKAGYATSPTYAKALIKIIEDHNLNQYDQYIIASAKGGRGKTKLVKNEEYSGARKVFYNNRVKYIIAGTNDTYEKISDELHLFSWQLSKYNEVSNTTRIQPGALVYLQPKRKKSAHGIKTHVVEDGETIYSISQKYAVKESSLRNRNNIPEDGEPDIGSTILLRGNIKGELPTIKLKLKEEQVEKDDEFEIEFDLGG